MKRSLAVLPFAALTFACTANEGDAEPQAALPIAHAQASLIAVRNVEHSIGLLGERATTLADHEQFAELVKLVDLVGLTGGDAPVVEEVIDGEGVDVIDGEGVDVIEEEAPADPHQMARDLAEELRAKVFADENVESQDDLSVTYRLNGPQLCEGAGEDGPEALADCLDWHERFPIRFRVTQPAEGDLDVAVLFGKSRLQALTVQLHTLSLGAELDVAAAGLVMAALVAANDPGALAQEWTGTGRLSIRTSANAAGDMSVTARIAQALSLTVKGDEGPYTVEAAPTAIELTMPAAVNALSVLAFDIGRVKAAGTGLSFGGESCSDDGETFECTELVQDVELTLGGMTGALQMDPEAATVKVLNLVFAGEGSQLKIDQVLAASIKVVGDVVSPLAVTIKSPGEGLVDLALSRAIGLQIFGSPKAMEPESDAADIDLTLTLDGAEQPAIQFIQELAEGVSGLKVLVGRFTVTSPTETVRAEAGECLQSQASESDSPEGDSALASVPAYEVVDCGG